MLYSTIPGFHSQQKWWRMQICDKMGEPWKDIYCFREVEWAADDFELLARDMWESGRLTYMSFVLSEEEEQGIIGRDTQIQDDFDYYH